MHFSSFKSNLIPQIIKYTVGLTLILTFFSLAFHTLFTQFFKLPSPEHFLGLTTWGIHKFFLWQFISYTFIQPVVSNGISVSVIIQVFFDLYLLWNIGSAIVNSKGQKNFLGLYYGGGCFIGIIAYLLLLMFNSSICFSGATPSIYILLIAWVFLFPYAKLSLFLFFPIQAKWVVLGIIGVNLFLDFSNGNFFYFFINISAVTYAYFYAVFFWEILSPFQRLNKIEKKIIHLKNHFKKIFGFYRDIEVQRSNIYDIKTKKKFCSDNEFIDICLEKISKRGKKALNLKERFRMWRISKNKSI